MSIKIDAIDTKRHFNNKKEIHRENGPAVESYSGDKAWYINGKRHRLDGPAIEVLDGYKSWYINDIELSKEEFNSWILRIQRCI